MSYLNGRQVENLVVPVQCESEQGTAFFISKTQLLTARHVVKAHFQSPLAPEPIYIKVSGQPILCKAQELNIPENVIDLALLTVEAETHFYSTDFLTLLCDQYVKDMSLYVYGYPQEIAMGCNLVDLKVRNSLEIPNVVWYNRALTRDDKLSLRNYDGLSGSPVVSISGRVTGIIVLQINETLSYLSISQVKKHLDNKKINYQTNWDEDDSTIMGIGRSLQHCKDSVASVHGRYNPKLHQTNSDLEKILDDFSDKVKLEESMQKVNDFVVSLNQLPENMKKEIQEKLKIQLSFDVDIRKINDFDKLKRCYFYVQSHSFKFVGDLNMIMELNRITYQLNEDDFERLRYSRKKNLCLIGKAGSGKTHSLCHYSLHNQSKANIYLFFGTNFKVSQSPIDLIREKVCQNISFMDFNTELKNRNRYAVIVIDAINEGLGCSYWNNHLAALRKKMDYYDHIRLVISIRMPFDKEINDLSEDRVWHIQTIDGFEEKNKAITKYFEYYGIDIEYRDLHIEAFKNPLFLKIFCEIFHSLTEEEKEKSNKQMLYQRYVVQKNQQVADLVNEDPELNITDRYLSKLANYCVYYGHFNPISRYKARQYAQRMAPYRLWDNDLLHACLTTNLLLDDRSHIGEPAVMFEYENLGDYYKANELLRSKMDVKDLLRWIEDEKKYLEGNSSIPSEKFRTTVKALFDCWYHQEQREELYNEKALQNGGSLYELYYEFLMESDVPDDELLSILVKLETEKINPLRLIQKFDEVTLDEVKKIHSKLKSYSTVSSRDFVWTRYVNQMYERNGDGYLGDISLERDQTKEVSDEDRVYLICITWMLTSSHPKFRAIIIRKLRKILNIHHFLNLWLIELFEDVNDPYVLVGLYSAVCGVVLSSRDIKLTAEIAGHIYRNYYEREETVPQDLIVRQWTLKIVERAYNLDQTCNYWERIKTPFTPQLIDKKAIPEFCKIHSDYFGTQQGSIRMYHSLFGSRDFNLYIIGLNNNSYSNDYFQLIDNGKYQGILLYDIMAEMAYCIMHVFGWNDKLGYLDNGKSSPNRSHNDQERIGKKFQWLAWNRVNAHLMDTYRTTKKQYFYSEEAEDKDLALKPYPWYSGAVSCFDPTIDVELRYDFGAGLLGIEKQPIKGKEDKDWINNNEFLPDFRYVAKFQDGLEYVMLIGYDNSEEDGKETFLFSNACFVKQNEAENFTVWAKDKNFHGRWMPENSGMINFLWNDYPWADSYKSSIQDGVWLDVRNCPCEIQLSYETQLQEDWEGIDQNNEFLTTVYMPCVEIMNQMDLYCSEKRGIIKTTDGSLAAFNTDYGSPVNGLFVRREILNDFLKQNGYVMFYYVLGEKLLRMENHNSNLKNLSAAYQYQLDSEVKKIQPMRVIENR